MTSDFATFRMSDPALTPDGVAWATAHSAHLGGRGDVGLYNVNAPGPSAPIVVLLHGVYGSAWSWLYAGGAGRALDTLKRAGPFTEFVLVTPSDGLHGSGSGYLPLPAADYERWILDDAPAVARAACAGVDNGSNVYLAGLSMGGYGALRIGFKHAARIAGVSAHSAITTLDDFDGFLDRTAHGFDALNTAETDLLHWARRHRTALPPLRFDCGQDDRLLHANRRLHDALTALGVAHDYTEQPGGHTWEYWARHITDTLQFFDRLERKTAQPSPM